MKLYCPECKEEVIVIEGITAFYAHRNWWCAKHAYFTYENGKPSVKVPSPGKLKKIKDERRRRNKYE